MSHFKIAKSQCHIAPENASANRKDFHMMYFKKEIAAVWQKLF